MSCPKCDNVSYVPADFTEFLKTSAGIVKCGNLKCGHEWYHSTPVGFNVELTDKPATRELDPEERPQYERCPHCDEGSYSCSQDSSDDMWNGEPQEVRCVGCKLYYFRAPHQTKEQ